jgi:hypothetical protein
MVNELEQRIGDALRADAATVGPESIPGVPPRPLRPSLRRTAAPGSRRTAGPWSTRGRVLVPLAAAAAVAATVVGLTVARPLPGSGRPAPGAAVASPSPGHRLLLPTTGRQPAHPGPLPKPVLGPTASRGVSATTAAPGVPRYYVTIYITGVGTPAVSDRLIVRDTATGKVVGQLDPPANAVFAGLAATAGGRAFVTAISSGNSCTTSGLYQFRLNAQGQPEPPVSLRVAVPGNIAQSVGDLAITPDGQTIAYATNGCDGSAKAVGLINLATRHVRVWNESGGPGNSLTDQVQSLSLSASGGLLSYESAGPVRILNTSAPGGSVFDHSRVVSATTFWGALASDGASFYGCALSPNDGMLPNVGTLTYYELPLAGGRQQVIGRWANVPGPQCLASLDPAGNYLLVQFPATAHGVDDWSRAAVLDLHTGRLTSIDAPAFYGPFDIAW